MFINDGTPGYIQASIGGTLIDALLIDSFANDFGVGGLSLELHCIPDQVLTVARGTVVVVGVVSYKVREVPDRADPGATIFKLEKV